MNVHAAPRILAAIGVFVALHAVTSPIAAHGKEVRVSLDSWTPQSSQPLVRLYEAQVRYAADQDPVLGARLTFAAEREEGDPQSEIGDVTFTPMPDSPGVYVAQVRYPRFGRWRVTLSTDVPGAAQATTTEQISPATAMAADTSLPLASQQVTVLVPFDWHGVLNILVRIVHAVGGVGYLGLAGALLANLALGRYLQSSPVWCQLVNKAVPLAMLCLLLVVASGFYTGYFDGPIRAPGALDVQTMARAPFGDAYLVAFWSKVILAAAVLAVIGFARPGRSFAGGAALARLSAAYGAIVVLLLATVAVLVYLHALSHLSSYLVNG